MGTMSLMFGGSKMGSLERSVVREIVATNMIATFGSSVPWAPLALLATPRRHDWRCATRPLCSLSSNPTLKTGNCKLLSPRG